VVIGMASMLSAFSGASAVVEHPSRFPGRVGTQYPSKERLEQTSPKENSRLLFQVAKT
jgi:hypothetical protein